MTNESIGMKPTMITGEQHDYPGGRRPASGRRPGRGPRRKIFRFDDAEKKHKNRSNE